MTSQTGSHCTECGLAVGPEELAHFGDRWVCPECKNAFVQKLREGAAPAGTVRFGGFWRRFVALLLDGIIMAIPMWIMQALLFAAVMPSMTRLAQPPNPSPEEAITVMAPFFAVMGLAMLIGMAMACAYETFFLVRFAATPGKMALGLKVVRPDGSKIQAGRAVGRYFAKMLSAFIMYIGYIIAGFDSQKRALHDMLCDTRVIRTRG